MDERKRTSWLADHAPSLRAEEIETINGTFQPYLFRKRKTRELWTTCCRQHVELTEDHPLLEAPHTKWLPWWAGYKEKEALPPPVECPVCGKKAILKELGRTGTRKNLWSYDRFIVLRKGRGCLWGIGVEAIKDYESPGTLNDAPEIKVLKIYRFAPGLAEQIGRHWYYAAQGRDFGNYERVEGVLKHGWKFQDGFDWCKECGQGYELLIPDGLQGTPYQYCQMEKYKGWGKMRYLALASVYPHQVEMLMKAGLCEIAEDMIKGTLDHGVLDWKEPNPAKSFGVSRAELLEWIAASKDKTVLTVYKRLKKGGVRASFGELQQLENYMGSVWFETVTTRMARYHLSWERLHNYLEKERLKIRGRGKNSPSTIDMAGWWKDYIDAAQVLGYDLENDVFLMPRDLREHHDNATQAAVAVKQAKAAGEMAEKERKRLAALCKRYTYADGDWIILPPMNAQDIVNEGKALRHCVGGYADRHVNGKTTILFLRDRKRPNVPRITIEMNGAEIRQIHGWDDERTACKENPKRKDPRKLYGEFLSGWLAWVQAGSKRDKKGRPVLSRKKKEVHVA